VPTGRPGEELLDPPKPTLDDGVGGRAESCRPLECSNQAASEWLQSNGTGRHERLRQSYETCGSSRALKSTQDGRVPVGPVGLEPTRFGLKVRSDEPVTGENRWY
jgi:hypothetical protein